MKGGGYSLTARWAGSMVRGSTDAISGLQQNYVHTFQRPDAQDFLINARNRNWMPAIKESLALGNSTTMMTVGVAHIGGRKGLVALLCGEGYKVERVGTNEDACGPEA